MLKLTIEETLFNEETEKFVEVGPFTLELEHSLISLSKWESTFERAFFGPEPKSRHETFTYVMMMHQGDETIPTDILQAINPSHVAKINQYIDSKQSATTFGKMPKGPGPSEVVTSELIYYWLVAYQIPFDVETWHLNRLLSLLRICNIKQSGKKERKLPKHEVAQTYRDLNEQRKKEHGTSG